MGKWKVTLKDVYGPYRSYLIQDIQHKLNDGRMCDTDTTDIASVFDWQDQPEGAAYWAMARAITEMIEYVDDNPTLKLSDQYTAKITSEGVKVGCETFSHDKIEELYKLSKKARSSK